MTPHLQFRYRTLPRSLLASAITGTLLAAIAVPAHASPTSDVLQRFQQQRSEQAAASSRDLQSASVASASRHQPRR